MGSKPKEEDYAQSPADRTNAQIAINRQKHFRDQYMPLLVEQKKFEKKNIESGLRGRANADTMQALSTANYNQNERVDRSSERASALQGQFGIAEASARDVKNRMATNTIGTIQGQAADASSGLAEASRLETSTALARARDKEQIRLAKLAAGTQLATAGMLKAGEKGLLGDKVKNYLSGEPTSTTQPSLYDPSEYKSLPIFQPYGVGSNIPYNWPKWGKAKP